MPLSEKCPTATCAACGGELYLTVSDFGPFEVYQHSHSIGCPGRCDHPSSVSEQACLLPKGHPPDSAERFHRFAPA